MSHSGAIDRELAVHRQFSKRDTVRVRARWHRGAFGVVVARLDDRGDGLARYGVRLSDGLVRTFARIELVRVRKR